MEEDQNSTNDQQAAELEALRRQNEELKSRLDDMEAARDQKRSTLPPASVDSLPANREEREAFVSRHVGEWLKNHRYSSLPASLQVNYLRQYNERMKEFFAAQTAFDAPQSNAEAFPGAVSNRRAGAELRMRNALRDMSALEYKMRLGNWGLSSRQLAQHAGLQHLDLLPEWQG